MTNASTKISIHMDPGSTAYLFDPSFDLAKSVFQEAVPDSTFERQLALHSPEVGTTLHIIITGLSLGAGIVAAEMLKEAGKDLWRGVKQLFKGENLKRLAFWRGSGGGYGDTLEITLEVGDIKVTGTLDGLKEGQEREVQTFLTEELVALYERIDSILASRGLPENREFVLPPYSREVTFTWEKGVWTLTGPLCPNCRYAKVSVDELPCRDCRYQGAKLGFKHNGVTYGPDGSPRSFPMDADPPFKSYYVPR